jgi:tyrosinase
MFLPLSKMGILNSIRTITTAKTNPHDQLRQVLEGGFHADVHNTLGGTMRTMASPFDPVFFGHHGTIDLMHFIHNRCHYGKKDNKKYDVFSKCTVATADGAAYTINANTDILIMYGNKPAENDPVIGKFFKDLGSTYNDFANAEKLKSASNNYRYVVDDYFEAVFKSQGIVCPPGTFASESKHKHHKHHKHHEDGSEYEEETVEVPVYEIIATLSTCGDELMERNPNMTEIEVAIQESVLECEATRQKSGHELEDYTPEFRQAFSMAADSHPQCYRLLNDVKNGAIKLEVSDFCRQEYGRLTGTNLTEGEFGKPLPPASGSDSDDYDSESDSYASGSSTDDDSHANKAAHVRVAVHVRSSE